MRRLLTALCLILVTALPAHSAMPGELAEGERLRELTMRGLTVEARALSAFRGKPLIINLWASYCAPCLAEMASLERLWQRHGAEFNLIGVSIDDYPERAHAFLAKVPTSFPHFIDTRLAMEHMLGANRIPLTVLVDRDGRVLHKVYGARAWDSPEVLRAIRRAFGPAAR